MQIKETPDVSFPGVVESPPLEDVVVLANSAGVALGVQRAFSARVRSVRDDGSGLIASRCVEIPLVGRDGEISGVLCWTAPRSDTRGVFFSRGPEGPRAIGDVAQFVVHDINNVLAVIGSGLRRLECQSDAAYRKAIVSKMQHAITRGALLSRQLLDAARPCPESIGGFVAGSRLAELAGTLDQALRPDITVRTDIAPDLWDFDADAEELYFALLNLCRNAADAIPDGGAITVAARNVEPSAGAARGFVEIVVADDGEGMTKEVLSQAFTPYFTTKAAGSGTGLGLAQVQRFAEGRGGAVGIESRLGAGTLVRLFLPRVGDSAVPSSLAGREVTYTPSPSGGVFHIVNPAKAAPTS
jgi:signal transduction histidine kinase